MIRVLHVVGKMHRAGQETVTMSVYREMDRSKVQFDFLVHTRDECYFDGEIVALGGRIFRVEKITRGPLRYIFAVRKAVRDSGCDVVHLHTAHSAGFFVLLAAKLAGSRVRVAHSRSDGGEPKWLHCLLRPLIVRYSTIRLACSQKAGRWMFGSADFRVLNDAIDAAKFAYDAGARVRTRAELSLGERLTIGHTGRFVAAKNHRFLAEVMRALKKIRPDFRALLAGDGELMPGIVALCRKYGLEENVLFLGSRDDVPSLLQAMDVFVFPSLHEGFGNSLIEAQAAGLYCVVSDALPTEAVVTPSVCRLPLDCGADRWAEAIVAGAGSPRASGAARVAEAGFDARGQALEYASIYEEALRPRS